MFQQQGGTMNNFQRFLKVSLCLIIFTSGVSYLYATASGITGRTQKNGSGCTCHSGSPNAGVSLVIAGPASLSPGQTGTYTVTTSQSATISGAGINIAASTGTLVAMTNLKVSGTELTQTGAKSGTTSYVWNFQYTAPVTAGAQTLYATGCVSYSGGWNNAPNFTVNVAADTNSITLTSPAGGESWRVGTAQTIKWFGGGSGALRLELSIDNGATWSDIDANVPAASPGTYNWVVPNSIAAQCQIRISDPTNPLLTATSKTFAILSNDFSNQILLEENFDDPTKTATLISGFNGWGTVTGTNAGTQISFRDSNLVFAGYPEGSGRAAFTSLSSTHKIYKNFTAPTSGVLYMSFLIKIPTAAQSLTNHIIGLGSGDMSATATYSLKTYCKWNAATTGYVFGLTTGSSSTYSATPTTLPAGKVGLVVIKYDIDANTEDLYVFPEGTTYPTMLPGTSDVHLTGGAVFVPSCVYIRSQTTLTVSSIIDGIRVATSWGEVTTDVKQIAKENQSFKLMQNYPNPFNPSTTINYQINQDSPVTLKVFNMLGKEVASLVNEFKAVGSYKVQFNASNLSSGVYYTELRSGSSVQVNKMILMK